MNRESKRDKIEQLKKRILDHTDVNALSVCSFCDEFILPAEEGFYYPEYGCYEEYYHSYLKVEEKLHLLKADVLPVGAYAARYREKKRCRNTFAVYGQGGRADGY